MKLRNLILITALVLALAYPASAITQPHSYDLKLLSHFNNEMGINTSTSYAPDSSRNLRSGQMYGTAALITAPANIPKFGNASLNIPVGNGSYVEYPDSPDWDTGAQNWSANLFLNLSSSIVYPSVFMSHNDTTINGRADVWYLNSATTVRFDQYASGSISCQNSVTVPAFVPNRWYMLTFIRNTSNLANSPVDIYVNGTYYGTGSCAGGLAGPNGPLQIGGSQNRTIAGSAGFIGRIDEVSWWQGGPQRSIAQFSQTTEQPMFINSSVTWGGYADDNSTASLFHADTDFTDQSGKLWSASNVVIAANASKFGPAGMYQGNAGILTGQPNADYDMQTGDWTVDYWWIPTANTFTGPLALPFTTFDGTDGYRIMHFTETNGLYLQSNASGTFTTDAAVLFSPSPTVGVATHIAVERNGTSILMFKDGQLIRQQTIPGTYRYNSYGNVPSIRGYNTSYDEVRITKGLARWTSNFTPPTYPYEVTIPSFTHNAGASADGVVQFIDLTPDSAWTQTTYVWLFWDGTSSTERNPIHTFASPGFGPVNLTVTNNNMSAVFNIANVSVGVPMVDFSCTPLTGTAALQVNCTDLTQSFAPITSRNMDWGDGTSTTLAGPWTHVYSTFGSFTLNLTESSAYGTDFESKRDYIITSTEQNQQQTWYTPHQVRFKLVDGDGNPIVNASVYCYYVSTTLPSGNTTWLATAYGVPISVAQDMTNNGLAMSGYTGEDGYVTFTQHGSLYYTILSSSPALGITNFSTKVMPLDSEYILQIQQNPVVDWNQNNTYMYINATTLNVTFPNTTHITVHLWYQDISGLSTNLKFMVFDGLNGTVYSNQTIASPGAGVNHLEYTLPNIRGNQYIWNYSAVSP